MKVEIVVNISRTSIQFFYSQNGNSFKSFKYENQEQIPFYVFSDGDEFQVGDTAKLKHQNHLPNCFHNYFELIKKPNEKYLFLDGEKKQIKHLLVHTCETVLNALLDKLLISERLSDLKTSLRLNLLFSSDITDDQINFSANLFKEHGYLKAKYIYGNYLIINYLDNNRKIGAFKDSKSNMGSFKGYLTIDALDNNLYIDFFNALDKKYPKIADVGEDLASDPKVKLIARELFKQTADVTGSLTTEESELPHLISLAQKFADSTRAEFKVKVTLSDGASKNVKIRMSKINNKLDYLSNFTKDVDLVNVIVKKSKIENTDLAIVINSSIRSENFVSNLRSYYNNVYHSKEYLIDVLDLFNEHKKVIENGNFLSVNSVSENDEKGNEKPNNIVKPTAPIKTAPKKTVFSKPARPSAPSRPPAPPKPPKPPAPPKPSFSPRSNSTAKKTNIQLPSPPLRPPKPGKVVKNSVTKIISQPARKAKSGSKPPPPPPPLPKK